MIWVISLISMKSVSHLDLNLIVICTYISGHRIDRRCISLGSCYWGCSLQCMLQSLSRYVSSDDIWPNYSQHSIKSHCLTGCDSKFKVKCSNFKSLYKWNKLLVLNLMYWIALENYNNNNQQFNKYYFCIWQFLSWPTRLDN